MEAIDRAVRRANDRLSHAEQVKRWAVLTNDLTVEGGDLTANLKLRRQAVSRRLQPVLGALYGAGDAPAVGGRGRCRNTRRGRRPTASS